MYVFKMQASTGIVETCLAFGDVKFRQEKNCLLKMSKCDIFDLFNSPYFYTRNPLWLDDFETWC
jgi:hypothetical protein